MPLLLGVLVLGFDVFWLYISANTARLGVRGYLRMRREVNADWHTRYAVVRGLHPEWLAWSDIRHVVIIPNYREREEILARCIESLAAQEVARQIVVVLAMESREDGALEKAARLELRYAGSFAAIYSTFHPADLVGEVRGKSSNEAWAARDAEQRLIAEEVDLDLVTISSCDADTIFHASHFSALTYKFATDGSRYRRFWQAPILLYNNIWETSVLLRAQSSISGVNMLGNLTKRNRMVFPQSTYHLSFRLAREVGYWDVDVIPEDWHMFLKCYYQTNGQVEIEPIFIPVGNDSVRARTYFQSLKEAYHQKRRHAWGVTDLPYAVIQSLHRTEMSFYRRFRRVWAVAANHLIWSTHWSLLTLGWIMPSVLHSAFGVPLPPGDMHVLARIALTAAVVPYLGIILIDIRMRPPLPAHWTFWTRTGAVVQWALLPISSLFFSMAPAVHAQTNLALGKRMEYRVTEKA